ncbi:MAG TPA: DUF1269 domain-containing protein [Aliiroseovarius sp.]|nr:DUF1269 domain-containing protein [Aliiroseovarius sp.]
MSELMVIGYDNPKTAEEARKALFGMAKEYLVDVADAVVATVDEKGKVKLGQIVHPWSVGMAGGAFWGLLIGLIFFMPLVGVLTGAAAGALTGALSDYGINDQFMKDVSDVLQPGQAALFILAKQNAPEKVVEELGKFGGTILRTNLDTEQEAKLRAAFDHAHEELTAQTGQSEVPA